MKQSYKKLLFVLSIAAPLTVSAEPTIHDLLECAVAAQIVADDMATDPHLSHIASFWQSEANWYSLGAYEQDSRFASS
ncbi:hypothetical protein VCO01S_31250 [Vibrio comitans NBRC 102076]|uniref:Uncharacterized protein n=1 Tax=Vibrio comitans NBRC 102076 TaxID=1219078 RepID=A0A4Y3IS44_9VIBR|nr:hypothetical protein VCO01S_31250 [Vibrio comitans NBRC 102076]